MGDNVQAAGSYNIDESNIVIKVRAVDPFDPKNLDFIYREMLPIVRHELEHAINGGEKNSEYPFPEISKHDAAMSEKYASPALQALYGYWLQPSEVRAMTLEMYMRAKKLRVTFTSLVREKMHRIYDEAIAGTLGDESVGESKVSEEEALKLAHDFRDAVMKYARERLGNVIGNPRYAPQEHLD